MSNAAAPAPVAPPTDKKWLVWLKWGAAAFSVVAGGLVLIAKLAEPYVLPNCDSKRATDTLRSIFKDKNLPDPTLTGAKETGSTKDDKTCETAYAIPNEKGALDYRVYWEGKDVKVLITKVRQ